MASCVSTLSIAYRTTGNINAVVHNVLQLNTWYTVGSCPTGVLLTNQEYAHMQPTPSLTAAEVAELSTAVIGLWAAAWAVRVLRRLIPK